MGSGMCFICTGSEDSVGTESGSGGGGWVIIRLSLSLLARGAQRKPLVSPVLVLGKLSMVSFTHLT